MPVFSVSWHDANRLLCVWRSEREGREYRLPGEVEWEKAARGVDGRFHPWGNRFDPMFCKMRDSTETVRTTRAGWGAYPTDESPYGVRDMAGGIEDWCEDWFDDQKTLRSVRGGAWGNASTYCRVAFRFRLDPTNRDSSFGFGWSRCRPGLRWCPVRVFDRAYSCGLTVVVPPESAKSITVRDRPGIARVLRRMKQAAFEPLVVSLLVIVSRYSKTARRSWRVAEQDELVEALRFDGHVGSGSRRTCGRTAVSTNASGSSGSLCSRGRSARSARDHGAGIYSVGTYDRSGPFPWKHCHKRLPARSCLRTRRRRAPVSGPR